MTTGRVVVDASVIVDAITVGSSPVIDRLARARELHAGQHLLAEVASALRTGERAHGWSVGPGSLTLARALPVRLHPITPHLDRVWELRHDLSPYDAWYVAIAEVLNSPLLTLDRRIAGAPGLRCEVVGVGG